MVDEVDEKTFDVRTIVILISHDEQSSISQSIDILIFRSDLDSQDLDDILNLCIIHDLLVGCLPDIHKFAFERKDTESISSHDFNASKRQTLG